MIRKPDGGENRMGDRTILHSDMNCFYASVEMLHHPELAGKPLAVGGDPEARHGIVLTANYIAKKCGVKTGMALWQAKQVCPEIIFVPPRMDLYLRFSSMAREIYSDYAYSLVDGMKSGYFKVLAHPDVIFINNLPWDENAEKACDIIIATAKEYHIILEFNANGIRRGETTFVDGVRYPYPHKCFWDKVATLKLPVIVNSDCHGPEQIWDNIMDKAHLITKDWKLNVIESIF